MAGVLLLRHRTRTYHYAMQLNLPRHSTLPVNRLKCPVISCRRSFLQFIYFCLIILVYFIGNSQYFTLDLSRDKNFWYCITLNDNFWDNFVNENLKDSKIKLTRKWIFHSFHTQHSFDKHCKGTTEQCEIKNLQNMSSIVISSFSTVSVVCNEPVIL